MVSRSILFFIPLLMIMVHSRSQVIIPSKMELSFYGQIKDSTSNNPLPFSNIELQSEGKSLFSFSADDAGKFHFQLDTLGAFRIKVTTIGYRPKYLDYIPRPESVNQINLGNILLMNENILETVQVSKRISIVENRLDKMIYHVGKDSSLIGNTGEDIFKKLPMVSIGYNGNVALKGNQNVKILVNGKPSGIMNGNMVDALRMIPSDQIKSIEIMTNPPLKYDMESGAGIINIVTKRRTVNGLNGGVGTTFGTRQSNVSGNIAGQMGQMGISGSFGNSWSYPVASIISSISSNPTNEVVFEQKNESINRRNGTQLSVVVDYTLDSANSFISTLNFNNLAIEMKNNIQNVYPASAYELLGYVQNRQPSGNFDFSMDYIKKFGQSDGEIAFSSQYLRNKNDLTYDAEYNGQFEFGHNRGLNHEYTVQFDARYPIGSAMFDFGTKIIGRNIHSLVQRDTLDSNGNRLSNSQQNYAFKYRQQVMAGYATVNFPLGKLLRVNTGLRWEKTTLGGGNPNILGGFASNGDNLFPSVTLAYVASKNSTFKIVYGKRIQRPSLYYLNPFRNNSDRSNQMQGNPRLKSEMIHKFEIAGDFNILKSAGQINTSLYYKTIDNMIEPVVINTVENKYVIALQTFENIGKNRSVGFSGYSSIKFFGRFNLKANLDLYTYANSPFKEFLNTSVQTNKIFVMYKTFIGIDVNIGKGFTCDSYVFFDSPQKTFQGEFAAFNLWNISLKKRIFKNSAVVGLSIVDLFSNVKNLGNYSATPTFTQRGNFAIPFRSFGLSLSWQFGKEKSDAYQSKQKQIINDDQKLSDQ